MKRIYKEPESEQMKTKALIMQTTEMIKPSSLKQNDMIKPNAKQQPDMIVANAQKQSDRTMAD